MENLITDWELSLIGWLQTTFGVEAWSAWHLVTELGSAQALLVVIGAAFWLKGSSEGLRLLVAVLLAGVLVDILKVFIGEPRPYYAFFEIQAWRDSMGFGMPSGHSAAAMTLWGLLATMVRRWWFTLLAVLLIALIGISRIYFAVHSPLQVLMGWLLGLLIVIGMAYWRVPVVRFLERLSLWSQLTLATSSSLVLVLLQLVVFQNWSDNFAVPERWQQRYNEAVNFEAVRDNEVADVEALELYAAFDVTQTGVILGTWLLAIVVLRQGGFTSYGARRRGANCIVGLIAVILLILVLELTRRLPLLGFAVWVLIPLILGQWVPGLAARWVRR